MHLVVVFPCDACPASLPHCLHTPLPAGRPACSAYRFTLLHLSLLAPGPLAASGAKAASSSECSLARASPGVSLRLVCGGWSGGARMSKHSSNGGGDGSGGGSSGGGSSGGGSSGGGSGQQQGGSRSSSSKGVGRKQQKGNSSSSKGLGVAEAGDPWQCSIIRPPTRPLNPSPLAHPSRLHPPSHLTRHHPPTRPPTHPTSPVSTRSCPPTHPHTFMPLPCHQSPTHPPSHPSTHT